MLKSQKGVAHLVLIVIVVVLFLAIGAAGYYVWSQRTGNSVALPLVGPSDKCEYNDPNLCKYLNNFAAMQNYTVTSTSSGSVMKAEIGGNGDSHTVMTEGGKETYNVITIKDTTYTKDYSDGKWWKEIAAKDDSNPKDKTAISEESSNSDKSDQAKPQYKSAGKEACGNLECYKYQVINPGVEDTEYIWFDTKQYKLRKATFTSKDGGTSTEEYAYGSVNIKAPSPVKEGSPAAATSASSAVDQAAMEAAAQAAAAQASQDDQ